MKQIRYKTARAAVAVNALTVAMTQHTSFHFSNLLHLLAGMLVGCVTLFSAIPAPAFAQSPVSASPDAVAAQHSAQALKDYVLGSGDVVKITVFQNPDLAVETRVSENGSITYPLIGSVAVGGLSTSTVEKRIARLLKDGGFLIDPQVTVMIEQIHGNEVAALGQFTHPGRFPLETTQMRLSDLIAQAGGIAQSGSDIVILSGTRDGHSIWRQIDVGNMFVHNKMDADVILQAGDVLFVDRYPLLYIYGEVQRPGSYRVERDMTLVQALAAGGGLTTRGTQRGVRIKRRDESGQDGGACTGTGRTSSTR